MNRLAMLAGLAAIASIDEHGRPLKARSKKSPRADARARRRKKLQKQGRKAARKGRK